jgi:hypothetical protein
MNFLEFFLPEKAVGEYIANGGEINGFVKEP